MRDKVTIKSFTSGCFPEHEKAHQHVKVEVKRDVLALLFGEAPNVKLGAKQPYFLSSPECKHHLGNKKGTHILYMHSVQSLEKKRLCMHMHKCTSTCIMVCSRHMQTDLVYWLQLKLGHLDGNVQIGYCATPEWRKWCCWRHGLKKEACAISTIHISIYQPIVVHARSCRDRVEVRSNLHTVQCKWLDSSKNPITHTATFEHGEFIPTSHHNNWVVLSISSLSKDVECLGYCNTCLCFDLNSLIGKEQAYYYTAEFSTRYTNNK